MARLLRRAAAGTLLLLPVQATAVAAQRAPSPRATAPSASPSRVASEFDALHFRSIGPATMSGRVADVAVFEANPAIYYLGTAHGGVWKTVNNGTTFTPLFQHEGLIAIGDVAVSQVNPDVVWVGAGESNNRQSTSWDGGLTWKPVLKGDDDTGANDVAISMACSW